MVSTMDYSCKGGGNLGGGRPIGGNDGIEKAGRWSGEDPTRLVQAPEWYNGGLGGNGYRTGVWSEKDTGSQRGFG